MFPIIYNKEDAANAGELIVIGEFSHYTTNKEFIDNKKEAFTLLLITSLTMLTIIFISSYRYFTSE